LFINVYTDYIESIAKTKFKKWDVSTITAADYTVEMEISDEFYQQFLETHGNDKPPDTPMVVHFRSWLTDKLQTNISQQPDDWATWERSREVKVANISFAYNNAGAVKLLR
jgi:hypothetical protein